MNKMINVWSAIVGLFALAGCAVTDVEQSAHLERYKTFSWGKSEVKVTDPIYHTNLIDASIKKIVGEEFAKHGVRYDPKNSDMLVTYITYTEQKQLASGSSAYYYPFYPAWYYPYGWYPFGWFGYRYASSPPYYSTYTLGRLIITVSDRKTGKHLWLGTVQGNVDNVKHLRKNIEKGVKAIMKKYPANVYELIPLPKDKVS